MGFFDTIAAFINALISALQNLGKFKLPSVPELPQITPPEVGLAPAPADTSKPLPGGTSPKPNPYVKRHLVTIPENITARFNDTGSPAWANQPGGKHLGTDYGAPKGSAVYAAYDVQVTKIGHYEDEGRFGDYVMGTLGDGNEYYSGHLQNVKVQEGNFVKGGQQIGETNYLNHTHIQLRIGGQLSDFEGYILKH